MLRSVKSNIKKKIEPNLRLKSPKKAKLHNSDSKGRFNSPIATQSP